MVDLAKVSGTGDLGRGRAKIQNKQPKQSAKIKGQEFKTLKLNGMTISKKIV